MLSGLNHRHAIHVITKKLKLLYDFRRPFTITTVWESQFILPYELSWLIIATITLCKYLNNSIKTFISFMVGGSSESSINLYFGNICLLINYKLKKFLPFRAIFKEKGRFSNRTIRISNGLLQRTSCRKYENCSEYTKLCHFLYSVFPAHHAELTC